MPSLAASPIGGCSTYLASAQVASVTAVKTTPGSFYGGVIYNPNATVAYVQLFDAAVASVTLGTTTPKLTLPVPATSALVLPQSAEGKAAFYTAISTAATTTPTGSTAPGTGLVTNLFFQ